MATRVVNRTERLNTIEQLLFRNPTGMRVVEIASLCEVDRRTIYRDMNALIKTGVPVYQKDGRFFIHQDYYLSTLRLNLTEGVMVMLAIRMLLSQHDQHNPHLIGILRKLGDVMPELPATHLSALVQGLWESPVDRAYVQVLETMVRGWGEHSIVKLWRGEAAHDFATYFIEPSPTGNAYAVGYDYVKQRVCAVKVKSIKRAKLLKTTYSVPSEGEMQRYLSRVREMIDEEQGRNSSSPL